tara:strand:+ start:278 stop:460 length:183 start_codon:yes stop_codon:yes gene_type:complete
MRKYNEDQIKLAVDIVIGDDGFRSKEVIEVIKQIKQEEEEHMESRIDGHIQSEVDRIRGK